MGTQQIFAYVLYAGTGSQTTYSFQFPYLQRDHIKVLVDGADATYTFLGTNTIKLTYPPLVGSTIEIRRESVGKDVPVDYADGSVLAESDLDALAIYTLYSAQEDVDRAGRGLTQKASGEYLAKGQRIANVAEPIDLQDAATKRFTVTQVAKALDIGEGPYVIDLFGADDGSGFMGFKRTGGYADTVMGKLRNWVSVLDYCTPAQRMDILSNSGLLDVSGAWQTALNLVAPNGEIDAGGGTHLLMSPVTMAGKSRVRVVGKGTRIIEGSPTTLNLFKFTSCDRLRFDDAHFVGSETYSYFAANTPTNRRKFIRVVDSSRVRLRDITGEGKRGHIALERCRASTVDGADFVGFFQPISAGKQDYSNECTMVEFIGGSSTRPLIVTRS